MNKIEKIKQLVNLLGKASDKYYNSDKPIMSDQEFDNLFNQLKSYIIKITSPRIKDLTNKIFGKLFVIGYIGQNKYYKSLWLCRCSCSKKTLKISEGTELSKGNIQSCGCLRVDRGKE